MAILDQSGPHPPVENPPTTTALPVNDVGRQLSTFKRPTNARSSSASSPRRVQVHVSRCAPFIAPIFRDKVSPMLHMEPQSVSNFFPVS